MSSDADQEFATASDSSSITEYVSAGSEPEVEPQPEVSLSSDVRVSLPQDESKPKVEDPGSHQETNVSASIEPMEKVLEGVPVAFPGTSSNVISRGPSILPGTSGTSPFANIRHVLDNAQKNVSPAFPLPPGLSR